MKIALLALARSPAPTMTDRPTERPTDHHYQMHLGQRPRRRRRRRRFWLRAHCTAMGRTTNAAPSTMVILQRSAPFSPSLVNQPNGFHNLQPLKWQCFILIGSATPSLHLGSTGQRPADRLLGPTKSERAPGPRQPRQTDIAVKCPPPPPPLSSSL